MSFAFIKRLLRKLSWPEAPPDARQAFGRRGEREAARFLRSRGHRIIARNHRCPAGELDLVSVDNGCTVFVEVKSRTSDGKQDLVEAVRPAQWRSIERAARHFLLQTGRSMDNVRFDLVTILWPKQGAPVIEHFDDAHVPERW